MPRRFLLTGGGTGGHVTPALAAAGMMAERYPDAIFRYAGLPGKAEGVMAPRAGIPLSRVFSRGLPSMGPGLIPFAWHLGWGILSALLILVRHRPDLILATGGYVAAPVVLANTLLRRFGLSRTPLLVHEQNAHLGRLNSIAARVADLVAVTFPETLQDIPAGKGIYVGYPVRKSCVSVDQAEARRSLGIDQKALVVFAFGGSQGARSLNRAVVDAAPSLLENPALWLLHGCGRPFGKTRSRGVYHGLREIEDRLRKTRPDLHDHPRYLRRGFIEDMAAYYAACDLVICRAGAGSLMEVCAQGKPAIVIPKSNLPADHQVRNARVLERAGACRVLYERLDPLAARAEEPRVPGKRLADLVMQLLDDEPQRLRMTQAAKNIIDTDAAKLLVDCAAHLLGEGPRPDPCVPPPFAPDRVMGLNSNELEKLLVEVGSGGLQPLDPAERELLLSKIDDLLASRNWLLRARGARLVGLACYREAAGVLTAMAKHGEPMVRRDALKGLRGLGSKALPPAMMAETLDRGLADSYYEARSEAALTLALCNGDLDPAARPKLAARLADLCRDHSFEVRMSSVRALARLADTPEPVLSALARLRYDPVWKVRSALFEAYAELSDRRVISQQTAQEALDAVLITANGYMTDYQIRHRRNEAMRRIGRRES